MKQILDEVMTVSEIAERYLLHREYVGAVVARGRLLKEGREAGGGTDERSSDRDD